MQKKVYILHFGIRVKRVWKGCMCIRKYNLYYLLYTFGILVWTNLFLSVITSLIDVMQI